MSIFNLERDMCWVDMVSSEVAWISSDFSAASWNIGNDSTVGQRINSAASEYLSVTNSSEAYLFGCKILPPPAGEFVPYRLRGACHFGGRVSWGVGFATGGNACTEQKLLVSDKTCDTIVACLGQSDGDTNFDDPLFFWCLAERNSSTDLFSHISVQRLISKPPQYASASS